MDGKRKIFPLKMNMENIHEKLRERQFVVVSFFGKTSHSARSRKGMYIEEFCGGSQFTETNSDVDESTIEMVVDQERDVIFLHLSSCYDTFTMAEKCKRFEEGLLSKGFLSFWSSKRYEHAKSLLFLFQVSHILVCVQPGHTVDISYIHLFKSLDNLRNKLQGSVSRIIKDIPGLSKEWISQGRMCSPRVLFLFLSAPISLRGTRGFRDDRKDTKPHKNPPIKRLEFSLEDQIYRILRKSRIITNIAANSLFALPANQEFVYVETGEAGSAMDPTTCMLNTLYSVINGEFSPAYSFNGPFYNQLCTDESRPKRCFSKFLTQHINQAFETGFSDNVAKFGPPAGNSPWEIPSLANWIKVSESLYQFFMETLTSAEGHDNSHAMCDLRDDMEIETIFSELRCKKILPQALGVYEENLPAYYNTEYHNAKLFQAMSVFSMQARGPASEKFAERLAAECHEIWRSGRVRCEEMSLTGNLCIHRKHTLPGQDPLQEEIIGERMVKKLLPNLLHSSGVQYIAACNCGRKQANREDPFNLYEANYGFYQEVEEDCCKDLEHLDFPVFNPLNVKESNQPAEEGKDLEPRRFVEKSDETSMETEEKVLELESPTVRVEEAPTSPLQEKEGGGTGSSPTGARLADTPTLQDETDIILEVLENIHIDGPPGKSPSKVESLFARSSSQFLAHMKTLGSPPGLRPEFSSWSLILMGASQLYSHSQGLGNMPGFMSSSKFLLPWEIPLTKVGEEELAEKWSNILEYAARRATLFTPEENKEKITVKVFLGFEYECPRGHRFMVSAPDKPMKSSSTMRGAAQDLVSSDMPLYMACPCRSKSPPVAQLMRLHLVTPKAPLHVTLFPQVQPVPGGPVFVSGWDAPARLAISSYWVMRLPYVYWGEGGAHLPPINPPTREHQSGVLLKGCISIDENYVES